VPERVPHKPEGLVLLLWIGIRESSRAFSCREAYLTHTLASEHSLDNSSMDSLTSSGL
jgi:hypothetical protein